MQALKILVLAMGALLLAGTIALVAAIVARVERGPAPAGDHRAPPPLRTVLPAPGRIVATELAGDRLLVRVALADGGEELVLFDARNGAELAVIELRAGGAGKATP